MKIPTTNGVCVRTNRTANVPEGWVVAPLSDCVDILDHLRVPVNSKEREKRQGQIPYYGATGQVGWINDYLFNEELLLLGEDGAPFLDKSKPIAYIINGKSWVNNHAHVLRAIKGLTSNHFLKFYLDMIDFSDFVSGTTRLKLNQGVMQRIPVVLPPMTEQKRIVAKVEQLLVQVNAARERLAKVPAILKRFRQSVLAAACSGRLTADWRDNTRLQLTRTQQVDSTALDRESDAQDNHRNDDWNSVGIPDSWDRALLSEIAESRLGKMLDKKKNVGLPTKYLRNVNVRWFGFNLSDLLEIRATKKERANLGLRSGDVLVCEGGEPGRAAVWENQADGLIFQKALHRIRLKGGMQPKWLVYNLKVDADSKRLDSLFTGTTIKHLTGKSIAKYPIAIPPVKEQHEIVRRVEALFKMADHIEARYERAKTHVDKLTQSILAKAFRGELVPTEAELARLEGGDYEPASVLLERIKAEREALEKEKRPKKRAELRRRRHRTAAKETTTESKSAVSADTSESPKRVSTESDSSSHMTAVFYADNKGTSAKQRKTSLAAKKHKPKISQRPVTLSDLETDEVMAAFRKASIGRGTITREVLLKEVSLVMGYQRLGSAIQERLRGHLRAAIRRKIIGTNGAEVWLETRTMDDYDRADLVGFLGSVMRWDKEYDREEVIRALANYLGFRRLTEGVQAPIRSAINSAIRQGNIVATGPTIHRIL